MTATRLGRSSAPTRDSSSSRRWRWGWGQYFALAAVPILFIHVWTIVAWLADNPHQITEFQTVGSVDWYAAKTLEVIATLVSLAVIVYLIRGCRREGRLLTFDVMFCLCGLTVFWSDLGTNFFQPTFLMSSNFINLNNTCGYMPFVVNPQCGVAPDPIYFNILTESTCVFAIALLANSLMRKARERWTNASKGQLILGFFGGFLLFDFVFNVPLTALGVAHYPAQHWISIPVGRGLRFVPFLAGLWFGMIVAIRIFKDDRGRTLVERGLDDLTPRRRTGVTLLALYGYFQVVSWVIGVSPLWFLGPYASPWDKLPRHVVNGVCDAPGFKGTAYGACPGSPEYRMPGRTTGNGS